MTFSNILAFVLISLAKLSLEETLNSFSYLVLEIHRIGYMDDKTWLLGNINQTGYFRMNYDLHNWKLLIQQLHNNHQVCLSVCIIDCF